MMRRRLLLVTVIAASVWTWGCKDETTPNASRAATSAAPAKGKKAATAAVAKLVFVGKEKACDCTRTRIDLGWTTVKKALGDPPRVPVQRLRSDADPIQVGGLREKKAMVTLPALYFLDAKGSVLKLLQGELKKEQIVAALGKTGS